jgi:hypothetical protein
MLSTETSINHSNYAYYRYMNYNGEYAYLDFHIKAIGYSVRCLKD